MVVPSSPEELHESVSELFFLLDPLVAVPDIQAYATEVLRLLLDLVGVLDHMLKKGFVNEPLAEVLLHVPE